MNYLFKSVTFVCLYLTGIAGQETLTGNVGGLKAIGNNQDRLYQDHQRWSFRQGSICHTDTGIMDLPVNEETGKGHNKIE